MLFYSLYGGGVTLRLLYHAEPSSLRPGLQSIRSIAGRSARRILRYTRQLHAALRAPAPNLNVVASHYTPDQQNVGTRYYLQS